MNTFDLFHFIRPLWLVAIPLLAIIWWLVRRREATTTLVGDLVAPHLADALTVNPSGRNGFRPVDGVVIAAITMAVAAAGPTWSKQPSPWFAETAPLVIAIEVSDSMRSNDLQPTRLDRARFRVLDLIRARTGSRTAIIAYSGSAHIVVPPSAVLPLAQNLLGTDAPIGTVLFVNDGFSPADVPALAEFSAEPGAASLLALVVGTDEGGVALMPDGSPVMADGGGRLDTGVDAGTLRRIENEAGIPVIRASTTGDDVGRLTRMIASNLQQADDPEAQWRDQGWWLLWPAAFLTLLWFRRGWTSQW
jgi:Ca-activated chloride channel family protein